jgi:hypothetical protein
MKMAFKRKHMKRAVGVTEREERGCKRKVRFATKDAARRTLHELKERGTGERRFYECRACGGWHLTSWE